MANTTKKREEAATKERAGVRLEKSLRRRLKVHAAAADRELQEVLDEAVEEYLKRHGA